MPVTDDMMALKSYRWQVKTEQFRCSGGIKRLLPYLGYYSLSHIFKIPPIVRYATVQYSTCFTVLFVQSLESHEKRIACARASPKYLILTVILPEILLTRSHHKLIFPLRRLSYSCQFFPVHTSTWQAAMSYK